MQQAYADFSGFTTLTLYSDDEIDLGFGVAAAAGAGMQMPGTDPSLSRMLIDFEATAGVEEGADLGLALGIWQVAPQAIQGGFIAVTFGADVVGGANLIIYFSMTEDPELSGIVLDLTAGEEAEASVDFGFTLAFQVPPAGAAATGA